MEKNKKTFQLTDEERAKEQLFADEVAELMNKMTRQINLTKKR